MNETKIEEYKTLRDELKDNRKLVFERPLIIAGATLAAVFGASEHTLLGMMTLPILTALGFNLWFTVNRLKSSARIIAYLQLVHEEELCDWIGWESALRKHREWQFAHKDISLHLKDGDNFKLYDHLAHYSGIYHFHLFLGCITAFILVAGSGSLQAVIHNKATIYQILLFAGNWVLLLFFVFFLMPHSPKRLQHGIETNRHIWIEALGRNSNNLLHMPAEQPATPQNGNNLFQKLVRWITVA